jgi:hypothetical protein
VIPTISTPHQPCSFALVLWDDYERRAHICPPTPTTHARCDVSPKVLGLNPKPSGLRVQPYTLNPSEPEGVRMQWH